MIFNCDEIKATILFACKMQWNSECCCVSPRPFDALTYRISGEGKIKCNGKTYEVKKNDVLYMPKNMEYTAEYTKSEVLAVHFLQSGYTPCAEVFCPTDSKEIRCVFESIISKWNSHALGNRFETTAKFYELLAIMCRQNANCRDMEKPTGFDIALKYLEDNFEDPDTNISQACRYAEISTAHFRKLFMKKFERQPIKYLLQLRINHAQKLIADGRYSIRTAAEMSGFNDSKYFSRVIKKKFGCTPSRLFKM